MFGILEVCTYLSLSDTAGVIQLRAELLQVAVEVAPLLLDLDPGLALGLQLRLELLDPSLELLDLLLEGRDQRLLLLEPAAQVVDLLVLPETGSIPICQVSFGGRHLGERAV